MLSGKQKLYFLLNRIDEKRAITPAGQPILIHPMGELVGHYPDLELLMLFKKLQDDEKVLRVTKTPPQGDERWNPSYDDDYYGLELQPAFDEYFLKIQNEPEYQDFSGKKPAQQPIKEDGNGAKYSRKALQKIWDVLQEIEEKRGITSFQDDISIPQVHFSKVRDDREASAYSDERLNILRKLENEEKAIKDVRWPNDFQKFVYLKIANNYFDVFKKYEELYKKAAHEFEQARPIQEAILDNPIYEVKYSEKTRKILINNFLVKKLQSFSENDSIFAYLYKNPNQEKSSEEIKLGTGLESVKDLNKFLENIGFTGDLRKVFFKASKDKIRFNNPITKEHLEELGIEHLKLV